MTRILIADHNAEDRETLLRMLQFSLPGDVDVVCTLDAASCLNALRERPAVTCLLLDQSLPGRDARSLLEDVFEIDPFLAVIVISRRGDETLAVQALQNGAHDFFIKKKITPAGLERAVTNAIDRAAMARKIEDQNNSLRSFAHVLVHDLRAPLRSVRGGVAMLLEDLPPEARDHHSEVLGFIRHGADRMDQLIVALYNYCSVEDRLDQRQEIDLQTLVQSVRTLLAADLQKAGAVVTADPDLPKIHGDSAQILQMMQNLVGNGIKYNENDLPTVHFSAVDHGDRWQVRVIDNGIGIDKEHLEDVFKPFRRLHRHEEYEGSGLGLATCRRIAERHGGRLHCRSTPGRGTAFIFELPKPVQETSAAPETQLLRAVGR